MEKMQMKKEYNGKVRKEIWLTKTAIKKLSQKAKENRRKLKPHMEFILEQSCEV